MVHSPSTKGRNVQAVIFQDEIRFAEVQDVIFGIVFFNRPDVCVIFQGLDGCIEILIVFLQEDLPEFFAMVAGVGFEIFVTVEDIEDLNFHVGQIIWHDQYYELIYNIGASLHDAGELFLNSIELSCD